MLFQGLSVFIHNCQDMPSFRWVNCEAVSSFGHSDKDSIQMPENGGLVVSVCKLKNRTSIASVESPRNKDPGVRFGIHKIHRSQVCCRLTSGFERGQWLIGN